MLIWLDDPSDLLSTSWMPASLQDGAHRTTSDHTVPGAAGRSSTTPAAFSPCTGWGWCPGSGDREEVPSWPPRRPWRWRRHLLGLAVADADVPSPSPTITRAVKLKRRHPSRPWRRGDRHDPLQVGGLVGWPPRRSSRPSTCWRSASALSALGSAHETSHSLSRSGWASQGQATLAGAVGRAAILPWYLFPARRRHGLDPRSLAGRRPARRPTAFAVLSPSTVRRSDSIEEADASVLRPGRRRTAR
jgi:hypothetical protein